MNGLRNGNGKEYNSEGKLEFEGDYLNGQRWNGKGYNKNDIMNFQIVDGCGKGIEYNNDELNIIFPFYLFYHLNILLQIYSYCKLECKKEFLNTKRNRKGKEYNYYGKLEYEGEYLNGRRNGKGKEYYNNGKLEYEGEYLNGKRNGKGKEYNSSGELEYEGEYLNGKRNGKGKEYNNSGELEFE